MGGCKASTVPGSRNRNTAPDARQDGQGRPPGRTSSHRSSTLKVGLALVCPRWRRRKRRPGLPARAFPFSVDASEKPNPQSRSRIFHVGSDAVAKEPERPPLHSLLGESCRQPGERLRLHQRRCDSTSTLRLGLGAQGRRLSLRPQPDRSLGRVRARPILGAQGRGVRYGGAGGVNPPAHCADTQGRAKCQRSRMISRSGGGSPLWRSDRV